MNQALEGLRVLDFTQGMAGPLATMILADYGAEVIRVETTAENPPWADAPSLIWNRGKKSVALDLTSPLSDDRLTGLIRSADVLVESFRPGEADAMGFGYERAAKLNPALVYHSISAFGQDGPYRNLRAYDGIVNAKAGRMHDQVGWQPNRPNYRAVNDTSWHTAMFSVQGILAALRVAWMTGRGQRVETSLLRGVTAPNNPWRRFEGQELPPDQYPQRASTAEVLRGELVADRRETDPYSAIPSQLCTECKDGRWIMHAHIQFGLFKAWIDTLGFSWIWDDPRYQGAPSTYPSDEDRIALNLMLVARMKEKTAPEWMEIYRQHPDCVGEVMESTQEALRHPQFLHNGHLIEISDPRVGRLEQVGALASMSQTPPVINRPAPFPGQHTAEVFAGLTPRVPRAPTGGDPARPLEGVVILELATWLATPFAGALLADLGASLIKVEPLTGDPMRANIANENGIRATQGKESIAVNLKTQEGQQILGRLVARADVVLHNFRPGAPTRIGMDYETLRAIKPDLVYVYAASYGSTGPNAQRAAFNPTMGAFSGNSVFQSGAGNNPMGDQSPDPIAGSGAATAVMLGLAARLWTGKGQYVETTMINSVVMCNSDDAMDFEGKPPRHEPDGAQLGLEATYRLYPTAGGWAFLAAPHDDEFRAFCTAVGHEELADDPRFASTQARYAHREALGALIEPIFMTATADEWESRLTAADVGCVRADRSGHRRFLYEDSHTQATGFMVPTRHWLFRALAPDGTYWRHGPAVGFSATPCEPGRPYCALGEQTQAILADIGYDPDEIARLKDADVVSWPAELGEQAAVQRQTGARQKATEGSSR
jgi:crotonobetainyl-CoA:carnitine CoA-transferase CaiB-like acyl-CoA transferase